MAEKERGNIAKLGSRVECVYSGFDFDGELVDSCVESGSVEIVLGQNELNPGLASAMIGMSEGEQKTVYVEAGQSFQDPSHALYGKDIIYEIKILKIQ